MTKKQFITLNNNIDKLIAFTPSLDKHYRTNQMVSSKPFQIETLDVIENLQDKGWKIKGSYQNLNPKTKQIKDHTIKMEHPDFSMLNSKGKTEAIANLTIGNSCDGSSPLDLNLGVFRLVCSNGMIRRDTLQAQNINHNESNYYNLNKILSDLNIQTSEVIKEFSFLKKKDLTPEEIFNFALKSAKKRFGNKKVIESSQLLKAVRSEDEGNNLWNVFNRIQENLTQPFRLLDLKGNKLLGINSISQDIKINSELSELAYSYV